MSNGTDQPDDWQNRIDAERMEVDRMFHEKLETTSISNRTWELVMTAVTLKIVDDGDGRGYRIEPNLDRIESVIPTIEELDSNWFTPDPDEPQGVMGKFLRLFERKETIGPNRREIEALADEYARLLQIVLERNNKWRDIVEQAKDE